MPLVCKYIAFHVPDLRAAEDFYRRVFGMDLLFREVERDGEWWALRADMGWEDADAAGIEVGIVALRRDELVIALFRGTPTPGTVYEICLTLPFDEIERRLAAVSEDVNVVERDARWVRFDDPFGFRWVLQQPDLGFRSSGEIAGRWLDI